MVNFASSSKYRKEREKNGVMHLTLSTGRKEKMYTVNVSIFRKEREDVHNVSKYRNKRDQDMQCI